MKYEVKLPSLGEDENIEAEVSQWLVKVGATVAEDDDILEITTDKAAFNVPTPKSGTVIELIVQDGNKLRVGDTICIIEI